MLATAYRKAKECMLSNEFADKLTTTNDESITIGCIEGIDEGTADGIIDGSLEGCREGKVVG